MAIKLTNKGGCDIELSLYSGGELEFCMFNTHGDKYGYSYSYSSFAFVDLEELKSIIRMLEDNSV